jgi:hypothetical protein
MINLVPKYPLENEQKENAEGLSQVETTAGQNRVDVITVFSLSRVSNDFDRHPSFQRLIKNIYLPFVYG